MIEDLRLGDLMTSREIQVGMLSEGNAAHEPIQSRGYQACDLSEGEILHGPVLSFLFPFFIRS